MSEIAKHTPGPWESDCGVVPPDGPQRYADIYKDGGDLIIAQFNDLIPEGRANARLIAAAPDLLAVLQEMFVEGPVHVALAGNPVACDALEARARAAIARASAGRAAERGS